MKIAIKTEDMADYGAWFSPCKRYRFSLWRIWDVSKLPAMFLMLNPSVANETANDPTVERCQRYAAAWGYGGLLVGNIFAYRATDPQIMKAQTDPVGDENDDAITMMANQAGIVVCAWGNHGTHMNRSQQVQDLLYANEIPAHCLKVNIATGEPAHPLYLSKKLEPVLYTKTAH